MILDYIIYTFGLSAIVSSFIYLVKIEHNSEILKNYQKLESMKKKTDDKEKLKQLDELQEKLMKLEHFH